MDDVNIRQNNDEIEIDIGRILRELLRKAWLIVAVSVIGAVIAFLLTYFLITPQYESSVMFYVNNNSLSASSGESSLDSITSADISASKYLVNSYIVILQTRESMNAVIEYSGVNRTYGQLMSMISASSVNSTEIFKVVVTSPNPQEAKQIADAVAAVLPDRITSIIEGTSAKVMDSASVATSPSSPNYKKNICIGFLAGFILSAAAIILLVAMDVTIRSEEDIAQSCKYPVLAAVPDMAAVSKGGYDYSYDRRRQRAGTPRTAKTPVLIGSEMSFASAEAYKLLRTKLQFSFADDSKSHVIGISSALSGEGKSLSAINLAYSLSQLGKKVILIDCDMRRPTLAEKLNLKKKPGLTDFLTGQSTLEMLIQQCGIAGDEEAFCVITAGQNPPNPIELLSSERMSKVLTGLREICDYVILDLPPVEEVSDALAVAKETDGILLVVRHNHCNRAVLNDAVRQFEFVDAKILGVIYNSTAENSGKYGKKYYRKYYYRGDRKKTESSRGAAPGRSNRQRTKNERRH